MMASVLESRSGRIFIAMVLAFWLVAGTAYTVGFIWHWGLMPKWLWEGGMWCSEPYATPTGCDIILYYCKIAVWCLYRTIIPAYLLRRVVVIPQKRTTETSTK